MPSIDVDEGNDFLRVCINLIFEMSKHFADSPCIIISIPSFMKIAKSVFNGVCCGQ